MDDFTFGSGPPNIFGAYQLQQQYPTYNYTSYQPKNTWTQSFGWYFKRQANNMTYIGGYNIYCAPFGRKPYVEYTAYINEQYKIFSAYVSIFYYKNACPCIFFGHNLCD